MPRILILIFLLSCKSSTPKDFKFSSGKYTSILLDESITILSDTLAIHTYKYNSLEYKDTLKFIYHQNNKLPENTSITLYSVSEKSKLFFKYHAFNTFEGDKLLFYRYIDGFSCLMIDPESRVPLFILNP